MRLKFNALFGKILYVKMKIDVKKMFHRPENAIITRSKINWSASDSDSCDDQLQHDHYGESASMYFEIFIVDDTFFLKGNMKSERESKFHASL